MNRNEKQNKGLALAATVVAIGVVFFALPNLASAQDGLPAGDEQADEQQAPAQVQPAATAQTQRTAPAQAQPIYESEKAWKFEDDNLIFFNPSPNQGGVRFIRWKDYNWMVTQNQIVISDQRPYGTQLQGLRNQMTKDGPQKDKDLMNDLKRQAGDIRDSRDPNSGRLPISIGIGFGFSGYHHGYHHGSHHGHHH